MNRIPIDPTYRRTAAQYYETLKSNPQADIGVTMAARMICAARDGASDTLDADLVTRLQAEHGESIPAATVGRLMRAAEMRGIRTRLGLTQGAMAERLGTTTSTVYRHEAGLAAVDEQTLRLARSIEAHPVGYVDVPIKPHHAGGGMYEQERVQPGVDLQATPDDVIDLVQEQLQDDEHVYELGVDDVPARIDDIRGRIHNQEGRIYAVAYREGDVRYFAVVEVART